VEEYETEKKKEEHETEEKKDRWWDNCSPDCTPDCDCIPCDLGLFILSWLAVTSPTRPARRRATAPGRAGMAAIRGYQRWLSPRLPTRCRHTPTCSAYGMEAVRRYGLVAGSRLTAGRLRRCKHPTPYDTLDPVP
jgi:putative membrane protein insertion efficiency factor